MNTFSQGFFITLEGIEGVGKSTALKFISYYLRKNNIPHQITREPGGTALAEKIRQLLLYPPDTEKIHEDTELLLIFASRAQHLSQIILPALKRGEWVICDRFTDASYAYQGGGRGVPYQRIQFLEQWLGDYQPDKTLLLDAPVKKALARTRHRLQRDRIEQEKDIFFHHVRNAYLQRAEKFPERYAIVNASKTLTEVKTALKSIMEKLVLLRRQEDKNECSGFLSS